MNIVLWVVAVVLALAFLAAGAMKLTRPKAALAESGLAWVEDFSPGAVKGIGAVEVLGALGLVLPAVTGIAPVLVPLAATGLALTMLGAAVVHGRRGETQMIGINVVLLLLAAFVAWGRFGAYAF
ncbi:DoxX family protein [Arthrobacter sp. NEB 688]|uniref:DoxX family protein n=1 Tax=Arthrobacter sp. NEB 688 TaxID=904039 RepID=UPI0015637AB0|nr:DoxX family protein [Arthrobacter sp. NEB 688]QKE83164.1 DoxX family protein [Arthrobacter sp. NEB 688]